MRDVGVSHYGAGPTVRAAGNQPPCIQLDTPSHRFVSGASTSEAGTTSGSLGCSVRLDPDGWLMRIDNMLDPARTTRNDRECDRNNEPPTLTRQVTSTVHQSQVAWRRLLRSASALRVTPTNRSGCQAPIANGKPSAKRAEAFSALHLPVSSGWKDPPAQKNYVPLDTSVQWVAPLPERSASAAERGLVDGGERGIVLRV